MCKKKHLREKFSDYKISDKDLKNIFKILIETFYMSKITVKAM